MTHRTSFALDSTTAARLRRLAAVWQVSQAEVVRRAVALASDQNDAKRPDPAAVLRELHASGKGLVREDAMAYVAESRANRADWRHEP